MSDRREEIWLEKSKFGGVFIQYNISLIYELCQMMTGTFKKKSNAYMVVMAMIGIPRYIAMTTISEGFDLQSRYNAKLDFCDFQLN